MPSRFPLGMSKFKMESSDGKSSVLRHVDGHVIQIAHAPLSNGLRKTLEEMAKKLPKENKMADGGKVSDKPTPEQIENYVEQSSPRNLTMYGPTPMSAPIPPLSNVPPIEYNQSDLSPEQRQHERETMEMIDQPITPMFAKGGQPLQVEPVSDEEANASVPQESPSPTGASVAPAPSPTGASVAPAPMTETQTAQAIAAPQQQTNPNDPVTPLNATAPGLPTPIDAYQQQLGAINAKANAESNIAAGQFQRQAIASNAMHQTQTQMSKLFFDTMKERNAALDEYKKSEINPDHYWDNHSKILSTIGLILGGFNPTNRANAAMEMLNAQREMDMRAQLENMNRKRNVLGAATEQFGNIRMGSEMLRMMQNDALAHDLDMEANRQADPLIRARALGLKGQLNADTAQRFLPFIAQQELVQRQRQAAAAPSQPNSHGDVTMDAYDKLLPEDPGLHVPILPNAGEADKKEIYDEIKQRKDIVNQAPNVMRLFDEAAKDQTLVNTLGGLRETGAAKAFREALLPLIGPISGTVKQAEIDSINDTLIPKATDTSDVLAHKRAATINWLISHRPNAVSSAHGLDLDRYKATSLDPKTLLDPKQNLKVTTLMKNNPQFRSSEEAIQYLHKIGRL